MEITVTNPIEEVYVASKKPKERSVSSVLSNNRSSKIVKKKSAPITIPENDEANIENLGKETQECQSSNEFGIYRFSLLQKKGETLLEDEDLKVASVEGRPKKRKGHILFCNVSLRYADFPLLLNRVSFEILPGQKVGVVDKANSSSNAVAFALCQLNNTEQGEIIIDGRNLSFVNIKKELFFAHKNPIAHSNTIRGNVDPFQKYSDAEILNALSVVQMRHLVVNNESGLDMIMDFNKLLPDERQLLFFAQGVLQKPSIIIVSEGEKENSAVQKKLHEIIFGYFKDTTVILLPRLRNTIEQCDKIIYIHEGEIIEEGEPNTLLQNPSSRLKELLENKKKKTKYKFNDLEWKKFFLKWDVENHNPNKYEFERICNEKGLTVANLKGKTENSTNTIYHDPVFKLQSLIKSHFNIDLNYEGIFDKIKKENPKLAETSDITLEKHSIFPYESKVKIPTVKVKKKVIRKRKHIPSTINRINSEKVIQCITYEDGSEKSPSALKNTKNSKTDVPTKTVNKKIVNTPVISQMDELIKNKKSVPMTSEVKQVYYLYQNKQDKTDAIGIKHVIESKNKPDYHKIFDDTNVCNTEELTELKQEDAIKKTTESTVNKRKPIIKKRIKKKSAGINKTSVIEDQSEASKSEVKRETKEKTEIDSPSSNTRKMSSRIVKHKVIPRNSTIEHNDETSKGVIITEIDNDLDDVITAENEAVSVGKTKTNHKISETGNRSKSNRQFNKHKSVEVYTFYGGGFKSTDKTTQDNEKENEIKIGELDKKQVNSVHKTGAILKNIEPLDTKKSKSFEDGQNEKISPTEKPRKKRTINKKRTQKITKPNNNTT